MSLFFNISIWALLIYKENNDHDRIFETGKHISFSQSGSSPEYIDFTRDPVSGEMTVRVNAGHFCVLLISIFVDDLPCTDVTDVKWSART